jgi:hypothetical protein
MIKIASSSLEALPRLDKGKVPKKMEYDFSRSSQSYPIKYTDVEKGQWPLTCR